METSRQPGISSSLCFRWFNIEKVLGSSGCCPFLVSPSGNGRAVTSELQTLAVVLHRLSMPLLSVHCKQTIKSIIIKICIYFFKSFLSDDIFVEFFRRDLYIRDVLSFNVKNVQWMLLVDAV